MKESKIIFQAAHKIEGLHKDANRTAQQLTEIVAVLYDMTGNDPTMEELSDFAKGGSLLSQKLADATKEDTKRFRSSSAKAAFAKSLADEQSRLVELQEQFIQALKAHNLGFGLFQLEGLIVKTRQSYLDAVMETFTVRVTEGSPRHQIYELTTKAAEALQQLKTALNEVGSTTSPVELQISFSPQGLIYVPDSPEMPTIETENFARFSDLL